MPYFVWCQICLNLFIEATLCRATFFSRVSVIINARTNDVLEIVNDCIVLRYGWVYAGFLGDTVDDVNVSRNR